MSYSVKKRNELVVLPFVYILTMHSIYLCYINIFVIEYTVYLMANIMISISLLDSNKKMTFYLFFTTSIILFLAHFVLKFSNYLDSIFFITFCLIFYIIQSGKNRYRIKLHETEFTLREVNRHLESKVAEKTKEYLKVIEELRLSEQKFFQAFYLNPEMSSITSLQEGVFLDVNNVYTQTTGYSKAELIGKTSLELGLWGNPEDRETLKYLIQKDQRVRNLDVVLRIKSGKLLYILFSAELINLNGKDCLISIAVNFVFKHYGRSPFTTSELLNRSCPM